MVVKSTQFAAVLYTQLCCFAAGVYACLPQGIAKQLAEGCVDLLEAREEDYAAANKRRALRTICSNMRGKQHEVSWGRDSWVCVGAHRG